MNADDLKTLWRTVTTAAADGAHPDVVRAAVRAVLAMHEPVAYQGKPGTTLCVECVQPWPCHTVRTFADRLGLRITISGGGRVL